jgi:hypothetical protein
MDNQLERPELELMLSRSVKDWGQAPNYTEEYRKIRWNPDSERIVGRGIFMPSWISRIRTERTKKANNRWNRLGRVYEKPDTSMGYMRDLKHCMRENIPFQTKSTWYNPADQWIYLYGNRALQYDLCSGKIIAFTFSGVYNKVTSFIFRKFGINVFNHKRKPAFINSRGILEMVNLNSLYSTSDIYQVSVTQRTFLINIDLYREYENSLRAWRTNTERINP